MVVEDLATDEGAGAWWWWWNSWQGRKEREQGDS